MGLFEESRSLVYLGPVMRRTKSDSGFTERWTDFVAALLDNYCEFSVIICKGALLIRYKVILCREETRRNGPTKRILVSRVSSTHSLRRYIFMSLTANTPVISPSWII